MITKLADMIRAKAGEYHPNEREHRLLRGYADELEAALPTWTRITDDPDTWPETEELFAYCMTDGVGGWYHHKIDLVWLWDDLKISEFYGRMWRPLCDLDYPPEEQS